jgi:hypothetical protein
MKFTHNFSKNISDFYYLYNIIFGEMMQKWLFKIVKFHVFKPGQITARIIKLPEPNWIH